ncbi:YdcF family protein [Mangrovibrevibacter kandeliae]|uniref:YdcF family protein n=1 Tax=Mangrovibrevibacter kandeliae TaxID=2968473 RepID=UPI0021197A9C|nr:YdcF family protein [Aurantimonas sp. CSK15Z-1]MCQ8783838.1 YdcF family protein [Aurantimonas sp. CSK15Z-1]
MTSVASIGEGDSRLVRRPRLRALAARHPWSTRLALACAVGTLLGGGYLAGGFLGFAQEVASFAARPHDQRADGIVVLTGGAQRLDQAIDLLKDGRARRLLISGVNPATSAHTLSKLTETDQALFDCCVDIDYAALNTVGNAEMTARWAQARGFGSLILVTSDYHMPRSLLEFDRLPASPVITPYPVVRDDLWATRSMPSLAGFRVLLTEYAKLLAARLRYAAGIEPTASVNDRIAHLAAN